MKGWGTDRSKKELGVELVREGRYVILTSKEELQRQLLGIERAGRTCYQSEKGPITKETAEKFVRMLIKRGHESVIEHSLLTVKFLNCSRGFTHELVRHRLASFSQESTRYVDYDDKIACVLPFHRNPDEAIVLSEKEQITPREMLENIWRYYQGLRKAGWTPEDARQILPNALVSEIVVSANFREWRHIFEMRTQKAAHWEIRLVMVKLLEELKQIIPVVFEDFQLGGVDQHGYKYYEKKIL